VQGREGQRKERGEDGERIRAPVVKKIKGQEDAGRDVLRMVEESPRVGK